MKYLIFFILILPLRISGPTITDGCKCKDIPLFGYVRVVDSFEDFTVRVVDSFEDLDVDTNIRIPDTCGEWVFVKSHEDFTIRYVDSFEDFTIRFVNDFPGIP